MKIKKIVKKEMGDVNVEIGAGSVYADLGFKDYAERETKADLIMEISKATKKKKLTQTQAADLFNISQPKLSELLNGRFKGYSVERLIYFLNKLGKDVDIVIKSKPRNRKACVSVYHHGENTQSVPEVSKER